MWTNHLLPHLSSFYNNCGLTSRFQNDEVYLHLAFQGIDQSWQNNLIKVNTIEYIMLSESPLWGNQGKYIYNNGYPKQSNFFSCNQLKQALKRKGINTLPVLTSKQEFVDVLNRMGFIIVDVSPFALNKINTAINYSQLSHRKNNNYSDLIKKTLNIFFNNTLSQLQCKLSQEKQVKVFYRYPRIETHLGTDISNILGKYGLQIMSPPNNCIFYQGGGIDIQKLANIL